MSGDHVIDAGEAVGGGVAADALVVDAVAVAVLVEQALQSVRIIGRRRSRDEDLRRPAWRNFAQPGRVVLD
jgi:hypothetical protein